MSALRRIRTHELWSADRKMAEPASARVGAEECLLSDGPGTASWPLLPRIGKYEIEAEIGHSALVRTFRAIDRNIGRRVTLKVLTDVAEPITERFRREVANAANSHNDGMITIYELGEHV